MQVHTLITASGNMTLILNNRNYLVGTDHPNYSKILDAIKTKTYNGLELLLDIPKAITSNMTAKSKGAVTVRDGQVFYNDMPMHNTVTERIMAFLSQGLPTDPLIKFLENCMANPIPMAVAELYDFMEHRGFPLTEDGCFIGYKGVKNDFTDAYSGKYDNTPNITEPRPGLLMPKMDPKDVDPDRRNECSKGLHVGTLEYARGYAPRVILVKVNPKDCFAVPKDHDCSKLRVCEYTVIGEAEKLIESPMYPMPVPTAPECDDLDCDIDGCCDNVPTTITPTPTQTTGMLNVIKNALGMGKKQPKRKPCSFCGAKGGKAHFFSCSRPKA